MEKERRDDAIRPRDAAVDRRAAPAGPAVARFGAGEIGGDATTAHRGSFDDAIGRLHAAIASANAEVWGGPAAPRGGHAVQLRARPEPDAAGKQDKADDKTLAAIEESLLRNARILADAKAKLATIDMSGLATALDGQVLLVEMSTRQERERLIDLKRRGGGDPGRVAAIDEGIELLLAESAALREAIAERKRELEAAHR